jgi:hypothetical protein
MKWFLLIFSFLFVNYLQGQTNSLLIADQVDPCIIMATTFDVPNCGFEVFRISTAEEMTPSMLVGTGVLYDNITFPSTTVIVTVGVGYYDAPPPIVYLNGKIWHLRFKTDLPTENYVSKKGLVTLAQTFCASRTIELLDSLSTKQLHQTLMHELLHANACNKVGGMRDSTYYNSTSDASLEHKGIDHIATFIADLFLYNPDLGKYYAGETIYEEANTK